MAYGRYGYRRRSLYPYRRRASRFVRPRRNVLVVNKTKTYRPRHLVRKEYRRLHYRGSKPELKYLDANAMGPTSLAGTPVNGTIYSLSNMAQGTTHAARLGNSIIGKSLHVKFDLHWNSAGQAIQKVGAGIFLKRETAGDNIDTSEIWDDNTQNFSRLQVAYAHNYRPLRLKQFNLHANRPIIHVNWYIKFGFEFKYNGTTSNLADTSKNLIQSILWSDQVANHPTLTNFYSRFRFIDS